MVWKITFTTLINKVTFLECYYFITHGRKVQCNGSYANGNDIDVETLCHVILHVFINNPMIYTRYYNSYLIWRTVSRRVDEVISLDHKRREASRVIQWYGLIHET